MGRITPQLAPRRQRHFGVCTRGVGVEQGAAVCAGVAQRQVEYGAMRRAIVVALHVVVAEFVDAQQTQAQCHLDTLMTHLSDIQGLCCNDGNRCSSGYPGDADTCSQICGHMFEPFWDSCGAMLALMGVGGTEGMTAFYDSCLETLYPPGHCAEECTPSMLNCRLMEVQAACCGDDHSNCPAGDPVPQHCPVGCALVFPFFLESCGDTLAAQGGDMEEFAKFADACTRQDSTALVEYATELKEQGCTLDLATNGRRLVDDSNDQYSHVVVKGSVDGSRRLQGASLPASSCVGFVDDPDSVLATHGMTCDQAILLGCDFTADSRSSPIPAGSLISDLCPVSCNNCHHKGMAQWIEAGADCPWDAFDDRLTEVNEVCCGADPTIADATCPDASPPRACTPLCAVTFHSLYVDCGQKLLSLVGTRSAAGFTAFDQLCTSTDSVDPMFFLDAIANAQCQMLVDNDGALQPNIGDPPTECAGYVDSADWQAQSGLYWITSSTGQAKVYCQMDTAGGGWTLLMKSRAGNHDTFHYESQHWTTPSVLNENEISADAGDSKYGVFNTETYTEWLAVFPEIPGRNWWHIGPFRPATGLTFFQTFQRLTLSPTSGPNWWGDPPNGYVSTEPSAQAFSVNENQANRHVRWGYVMNENGRNDFGSCDTSMGIGGNTPPSSGGDWFSCCGTQAQSPGVGREGNNAWYRFMIFGRTPVVTPEQEACETLGQHWVADSGQCTDYPPHTCDATTSDLCYSYFESGGGSHWNTMQAYCEGLGGFLAKEETAEQHTALQRLVSQRARNTRCPYMGANNHDHNTGHWDWPDGSTRFYREVRENGQGREHCSCWWTADNVLWDAPCDASWGGQNGHFICAFPL